MLPANPNVLALPLPEHLHGEASENQKLRSQNTWPFILRRLAAPGRQEASPATLQNPLERSKAHISL